eukprot:EG_transcript_20715
MEWHRPQDVVDRLARNGTQVHSLDTGIAFSRLNPVNMYHTMMEDHMPLFELIRHTPQLKRWLTSVKTNAASLQLLLFQDGWSRCHPGSDASDLLFPNVMRVEGPQDPSTIFQVKFLAAGTKASCVHAFHCTRGKFLTPNLGFQFRRFALRRAGVTREELPAEGTAPRVTVVQRGDTRQMANLAEVVSAVRNVLIAQYGSNASVTVLDFGHMSVPAQMLAAFHTDLLIMVHGGVYGNLLFLPRHAIVIDIYPYGFYPEQHGYHSNGIRLSMPAMHYGSIVVQTDVHSTSLL